MLDACPPAGAASGVWGGIPVYVNSLSYPKPNMSAPSWRPSLGGVCESGTLPSGGSDCPWSTFLTPGWPQGPEMTPL